MNILLNSIGQKTYLIRYFKEALNGSGKVFASNYAMYYPMTQADGYLITPKTYDDLYINTLVEFCQTNQISAIIPVSDQDLPILAKNKAKFAEHNISVVVSYLSAIEIFTDKWKTYQFLSSLGLPQPKTYIDLELAMQEIESGALKFPIVINSRWSSYEYELDTIEELNISYPRLLRKIIDNPCLCDVSQKEKIIIQEKVKGNEYNLDIFNDLKGNYITTVAKHIITKDGIEVLTAKIIDNKPFEHIVKLITDSLKPVSTISVDCIVTDAGEVVVKGIKGCFGELYPFAHLAGADFPKQITEWLKGFSTSDNYFSYELNVTGNVNQPPALHFSYPEKVTKQLNILMTTVRTRTYTVQQYKKALGKHGKLYAGNDIMTAALLEADEHIITPPIYSESYIDFLLNYCREKQISVIISSADFDLPVLAKNKELFKKHGITLVVSDLHVIDTCNDKWKACQFLLSIGLPQPKTYIDLDLLKRDIQNGIMSFPLIVKPRWGWDSFGLYQVNTPEELDVLYQKSYKAFINSPFAGLSDTDKNSCIIMQEKIENEEYGLNLLNDLNGNYVTTIVRKQLSINSGIKYSSQIIDSNLFEDTAKILSSNLKYIGMMDVDCFLTPSGEVIIIDLNPRYGDQYTFAHLAGADFPKQIVEWLLGNPTSEKNITVKTGVVGIKDIQIPVRI